MRSAPAAVCRAPAGARVSFQRCPTLPLEQMGCLDLVEVSSRGVFPVSASLGAYRRGNGNGWGLGPSIWFVTSAIASHHAIVGQLSQAGANRGSAQSAELAQLLHGDGLIQAGQDLLDALESLATARFRTRLRNGGVLRCDREG